MPTNQLRERREPVWRMGLEDLDTSSDVYDVSTGLTAFGIMQGLPLDSQVLEPRDHSWVQVVHNNKVPVAVCLHATVKANKLCRDTWIVSGVIPHAPVTRSDHQRNLH